MTETLFGVLGHLAWWQECDRTLVILVYGVAIVRIAGRRIFGKWTALDIVVSVIFGSNLSRALTGQAPLWGTLAATTVLMVLHWMLAQAAARSVWLADLLEGTPIELGRGGLTDRARMSRHSISPRDLNEAMRQSGVEQVGETRRIVLEPSGKMSVLKADPTSRID